MSNIENRKDAMLEKADARLKQVDAEIDRLKAKADEAAADQKLAVNKQLNDLEEQRQFLNSRVQAIREAGEDALTDLSDGFERAWAALSDAVGKARSRFQ
jgi:predicted  nucleic acid-binding Zn-ribbon protein